MTLADKIISLRKKNGLSQEELAEKMNVSRQSVSKWEGAQSVPDLNKIIAMSELFGVSTDYLLKDSISEPEFAAQEESGAALRQVCMEDKDYSREKKQARESAVNIVMIFWLVIVAAYLGISLITEKWEWTWVLLTVGGVLTPAVRELQKLGKKH